MAMDTVPQYSRLALDALSSMANIAGYRAVEAAHEFDDFLQSNYGRKVPPAKVLLLVLVSQGLRQSVRLVA